MRENKPTRYDGELIETGSQNGSRATSERNVQQTSSSRRRFMTASALIGAGAFGLSGPVGSVTASEHDTDGSTNGTGENDDEMDGVEGDIEILNFARTLELLEAEFYREGLDTIGVDGNPDLIPPALSIHSVEARHTSFLNVLNDEIGFPDAFDDALGMDEVLDIASQFIVD